MKEVSSVQQLPNAPAVYALYGGRGQSRHEAYVGITKTLRSRIIQHLVNRDSSVAVGTSAAGINPDYVTEVQWWEHPRFSNQVALAAAELVAFEVLQPALRSRGGIGIEASRLSQEDGFRTDFTIFFKGEASGRLVVPSLVDAMGRIAELERRLDELEARFRRR